MLGGISGVVGYKTFSEHKLESEGGLIFCILFSLDTPVLMKDWSTDRVCEWLQKIGYIGFTQMFREKNIDGYQLIHCTAEQLMNIVPRKLVCMDIVEQRDTHLATEEELSPEGSVSDQSSGSSHPQPFRKFDSPVTITDKYKDGDYFQNAESRPTDLLTPVRHFIKAKDNLDLKGPSFEEFAWKIIHFATACLNARSNGVIYFGVDGQHIRGLPLTISKSLLDIEITQKIRSSFPVDQVSPVLKCIRPLRFVEVIPRQKVRKYVIEVEIVPKSIWCGKLTFTCFSVGRFVPFHFGSNDLPCAMNDSEQAMYYANSKDKYIKDREFGDSQSMKIIPISYAPKLKENLINALCRGDDKFKGDRYPILVLSPIDESIDPSHFSFLKDVKWKLVLDFGSDSAIYDYLHNAGEVFRISEMSAFDPDQFKANPDYMKRLEDEIKTRGVPFWVFANGYDKLKSDQMQSREWKQKRRQGLRDCINLYLKAYPKNRIVTIFLLLSKDFSIMAEAADEFCSNIHSPYSYVCISENSSMAQSWMDILLGKDCMDKEILQKQTISGLPWPFVKETFDEITDNEPTFEYKVPTNLGLKVLSTRKRRTWTSLEIVAANHCEEDTGVKSLKARRAKSKEIAEQFYRGGKAEWWNFHLHHVCERNIHNKLTDMISASLVSQDYGGRDGIEIVTLYHQPGAGGSTCARHVLWDLKHRYKCAEVRSVTETTCSDIAAFREFGEQIGSDPQPVLLLLDNIEADQKMSLLEQMEEKSRHRDRNVQNVNRAYCVCLLVERRSAIPLSNPTEICFRLKQELTRAEQEQFHAKEYNLIADDEGIDPKKMIAFNILKENFDREYIKKTVTEYVNNLKSQKERFLLQYLAFLNYYDVKKKAPNVSSFDTFMDDDSLWEGSLSDEIQVLVHVHSAQKSDEGVRTISVCHSLLSKEILDVLKGTTLSAFTTDFFRHPFLGTHFAGKRLIEHLSGLLRIREIKADGSQEQFAPLILEILETENHDAAVNTLVAGYEVTQKVNSLIAARIAQQLARLYIKSSSWDEAMYFADQATKAAPDNFYFMDTKGQVYRDKLEFYLDNLKNTQTQKGVLTGSEILQAVKIAYEGMEIFEKVHEMASGMDTTITGRQGLLYIVASLLDCLALHPEFRKRHLSGPSHTTAVSSKLHQLLVDPDFYIEKLDYWTDIDGIDYITFIKSLQEKVKGCIRDIDEYHTHLFPAHFDTRMAKHIELTKKVVKWLKKRIDKYFVKPIEKGNPKQQQEDTIFQYETTTLNSLLKDGRTKGKEYLQYVQEHTYNKADSVESLLGLINVTIALWTIFPDDQHRFTFSDVAEWSKKMYAQRSLQPRLLEPYMYYVMFNWPQGNQLDLQKTISDALPKWRDLFTRKYPGQKEGGKGHSKMKTSHAFYFGKGEGMKSIVHNSVIHTRDDKPRGEGIWKDENTQRILKRFSGILSSRGENVLVHAAETNQPLFTIPSAYPINDSLWWNKPVNFVIGFTWMAPKAFDIQLDD